MNIIILCLIGFSFYDAKIIREARSETGCPSEREIIFNHYAEVLDEIHGYAYYPHLMAPPRKPERN